MIKLNNNSFYCNESEVPSEFLEGSSISTEIGNIYLYPKGAKVKMNADKNEVSTDFKRAVFSITQFGVGNPAISLLKNNTSFDLSSAVAVRVNAGQYKITIPYVPTSLYDLAQNNTYNLFGSTTTPATYAVVDFNSLSLNKSGRMEWYINVFDGANAGAPVDNGLDKSLLFVYTDE
jgi:hypothetical protein